MMNLWMRLVYSVTVLVVCVILLFLIAPWADASDGTFACWHYDGNIILAGYFHPAALEGGPIGGPDINGGLYVEVGEDCDYRVGSGPVYVYVPTPAPTPTPIATPEPTATPDPTPTPLPSPVAPVETPVWPYSPYCWWNDGQTVFYCRWIVGTDGPVIY